MKETHSYFACDWPDHPVPDGEPVTMYCDVILAKDAVWRMVEVFPNGQAAHRQASRSQETCPDI